MTIANSPMYGGLMGMPQTQPTQMPNTAAQMSNQLLSAPGGQAQGNTGLGNSLSGLANNMQMMFMANAAASRQGKPLPFPMLANLMNNGAQQSTPSSPQISGQPSQGGGNGDD